MNNGPCVGSGLWVQGTRAILALLVAVPARYRLVLLGRDAELPSHPSAACSRRRWARRTRSG